VSRRPATNAMMFILSMYLMKPKDTPVHPGKFNKSENKPWADADICKIWKKVSGSNLGDSMQYSAF
jgi:hypothetical protein